MKDRIDYEIIMMLRDFVDLKTYDKIINSLNLAQKKYNLNFEEYNHILYLTLKIVGFIDVFFYLDIDTYNEYVNVVCKTIEKFGNSLSKGTYSLYFEIVNIIYNIQFTKTNKSIKDFLIKRTLQNKAFNYDMRISDYTEFVDNLNYGKKINKKILTEYLDYQYKSDHTIIIDYLKKYFYQIANFNYTLLARYLKEKMDAINLINNKFFSKKDYLKLELIKSIDYYEIYDDDLIDLEEWIKENLFDDNGHSFKTNLNLLFKIVKDYLEEVKPERKESSIINIQDIKSK